jgi:hypothetical protein
MQPRLRNLILLFGVLLLAAAGMLWSNRAEPMPVSLVASGPTRCVIDLASAPSQAICEIDGASLAIPGPPTRWLVFESRGDSTVAGWAADLGEQPGQIVILVAKNASRVAAWPDRQQAHRIGFSTAHGYGESGVSHEGFVTYTP